MSPTWQSDTPEPPLKVGPAGWALVLLRGTVLGAVVFGGLGLLLLLRVIEQPLFGARRPVTPWITRGVCRSAFAILGIGYRRIGAPMTGHGAVVANHSSWLDIFALNAGDRVYFVSKSEVAGWPGIGWLARATGTLFIRRDPREARAQRDLLRQRLAAGHRLVFFPEGTSTDGLRVLPFKSTLFEAFFANEAKNALQVQPVTLIYRACDGQEPRFYGWWGDMEFGAHLIRILAAVRQGTIEVIYHPPLRPADFVDRKSFALALQRAVADGLESADLPRV